MKTNHTKLAQLAEKQTRKSFEIARKKLNICLDYQGVDLFNRKSKTAGYVEPSLNNVVHLNARLFARNVDYFLNVTIPHEVSHIIADAICDKAKRKERHHGKTWQSVMKNVFNLKPETYHNLNTRGIGIKTKKYKYICSCRKHILSAQAHAKIKKEKDCFYRCSYCKKTLTFLSEL